LLSLLLLLLLLLLLAWCDWSESLGRVTVLVRE
jgi:hypothetical protein